jgi:hypothetical protein
MPLDIAPTSFTTCSVCGGPIQINGDGRAYCPGCDPTECRQPKSKGVILRQRHMVKARQAGNRMAARNLARAVADYRRGVMREPEHCESDWTARCGGRAP